jgi:hypothetical protein
MRFYFRCILYFAFTATVVSCKKPYNPPAIALAGSYLVVEGVINSGSDSTIIRLSKTVKLSSATAINPVTGAAVAVQSDQGAAYPLTETTHGNYVSPSLNLNSSHNYRLSIKTSDEQYYSDYVPVLNSPPIDSLSFKIIDTGLTIYSATHDPSNTIKYYRWDFQETWIAHSSVSSGFVSNGDTVLTRTASQQVFTCWRTDTSSVIVLGSSAKLANDVIVNNPVTSLGYSSPKIANEYSIQVRQYALTPDAYTFWTNLKKNTEQLGSIFDAQPSQINGNIHSANDPSEPVIGYISVGSTASKRVFIAPSQLPAWPPPFPNGNYPADCTFMGCLYTYYPQGSAIPVNQVNEYINYNRGATNPLIPIAPIQVPGGPVLGYTAGTPICVDCTLQKGATNKEPAYWKF